MKSLPRVAIVGAGITGCTIAWKIRQGLGFNVDLYERRDDILLETTAGTSNRFHYGYQYALSDETAKTLRDYHQPFKAVYGQCVLASSNYYGIAANSQLSTLHYLNFCARCHLPIHLERPDGIFTDNVLLSLLSVEKSLGPDILRRLCWQKLQDHGINVIFAMATPAMLRSYDYVISTVYGNPNLLADSSRQEDYHFGLCEMIVVKLPASYRGISAMIVYGPFMTVDVLGDSVYHVLYHGFHGIHHVNVGKFPAIPYDYQPFLYRFTTASQLRGLTKAELALREAESFFHGIRGAQHIASNFVIRVQALNDVKNAVRRTSITEIKQGWFRIAASKLSACVAIADKMIFRLQQKEAGRFFAPSG
jgi:hypothetical protein